MPSPATSAGRSSVTAPTKPTVRPSGERGEPGLRQGRRVVVLHPDVGGDVLPRRAAVGVVGGVVRRHDAVDQVVVARVELVVARGRHLEAGLVQRVDRRLVVGDERLERRGADQVAGRGEHRVGVLSPQLLDGTRERGGTGLRRGRVVEQPAVEVVGGEHLHGVDVGVRDRVADVDADDLRVVVGGPERVDGVEVREVAVEAAVLVVHRLVGVDRPHVLAGDHVVGRLVGEHVVERTGETTEAVGLLVVGGVQVVVARGGEDLDRVFLGVGVVVAGQEHLVDLAVGLELVGEGDQRGGLALAVTVVRPGAVALVDVVAGRRATGVHPWT